jgi:hypothetical protein
MCLVIVMAFIVAWLPYELYLAVIVYTTSDVNILNGLKTLACVNSCVNPIIYGFMWKPFRASLVMVNVEFSREI